VRLVSGQANTPTPTPITPVPTSPAPTRIPAATRLPVSPVPTTVIPPLLPNLLIPVTGFAPGKVSVVGPQPEVMAYTSYSDLVLRIPGLGLKSSIVGVPYADGGWDVSWLGASVGYLGGTAFPTWKGNSVLTGHVYDADGLPGPFVNLSNLKWGDKIQVEAFGQVHTYEVRAVYTVTPYDQRPFAHKDDAWLTLITCKQYDAPTDSYKLRTIVQAILISVTDQAK
jgi:LPXTG-site transpeptidase (sortase) family protein